MDRVVLVLAFLAFMVWCAMVGTLGYVIVHFVVKYW